MPRSWPLAVAVLAVAVRAAATVEYNRDVRPILSDKCFVCHGPAAAAGTSKLRLDRPSSVVVPGDPANSPLYQRITAADPTRRMPPAIAGHERLADREIAIIREWIEQGGSWQSHWSLIAPSRRGAGIDAIVRERLAREGLKLSPEADRQTLIRRVTLDLTGLPPAAGNVAAFVNDTSPNAYERLVDRLLASSRYGERMAFRWMEAARYADTNGYQTDGVRDMWRWRDWVIHAFNRNMRFDRFTVEQIAGDLLPNPTLDQLIATAFHRNHRTTAEGGVVPEEYRTEYVADRVETTGTVWLGMTVGCARCHDHKYDPISQKDFYRLFAFFNNVPEKGLVYNWGNDEPLIKAPTPDQQQRLTQLDQELSRAQARFDALEPKVATSARKHMRKMKDWTVTDALVYRWNRKEEFDGTRFVEESADIANFDYLQPFTFSAFMRPDAPAGSILSHDEDHPEASGHGLHIISGRLRLHVVFRWTDIGLRVETADPLTFGRWQHVAVTYDGSRYASGVRMYVDGKPQQLKILFDELNWPMNFKVPFRIGAGSSLRFRGGIADARVYKRALSREEAEVIAGTNERWRARLFYLETNASEDIRAATERLNLARAARDEFYAGIPTVMVMSDAAPRQTYVLKRGAYDVPGEPVSPDVPGFLPQLPEGEPRNRLGLARWLVDRSNPLTARVIVNRFWQMLFGVGLVKTVEDFGSQGEWPVYPELLDWLAVEFMERGWDVKHILKTIIMSGTYRQRSNVTRDLLAKDPENRLLARGPRFRLSPEMIRDQALAVSSLLVEKLGGPSVKPVQPPGLWKELSGGKEYEPDKGEGLHRRSLYTFWKRTVAPPFMVNFDSPNRETCTVREARTNTPLQALNLMNDPAFVEAAEHLGVRMVKEGGSSDAERVAFAFREVLARAPRPDETSLVVDLIDDFRRRKGNDRLAFRAAASLILNFDETVTKQ
jgi:hypothetical protein